MGKVFDVKLFCDTCGIQAIDSDPDGWFEVRRTGRRDWLRQELFFCSPSCLARMAEMEQIGG
jgi:hypothetical protein